MSYFQKCDSSKRLKKRAVSIAGPIEIKCSDGRVDVSNTDAPIELVNINGDVDAIATNSSVRFTGKLRDGGRYHLKSMSGRVEMLLPANPSGFSATPSFYRGLVESAFNLTLSRPLLMLPKTVAEILAVRLRLSV